MNNPSKIMIVDLISLILQKLLKGRKRKKKEIKQYDTARTKSLNEYGIKVIRFWNQEVINETEKVLEKIAACLK